MLLASAQHPAMLKFLDNAYSNKDNPNENYGRELLELHSVSVEAGYSEEEMRNSTLLMTGFGVRLGHAAGSDYRKDDHHVGPVQIMGFSAKNGSAATGTPWGSTYLRYLANHPATARARSRGSCARGSCRTRPRRRSCRRWRRPTWPREPRSSRCCVSCSIRRSSPRRSGRRSAGPWRTWWRRCGSLGIEPDPTRREGMEGLYWMVDGLGNAPLAWPPPNGYPDEAVAWRRRAGRSAVGTRTCRSRRTGGRTSCVRAAAASRTCRRRCRTPTARWCRRSRKRLVFRPLAGRAARRRARAGRQGFADPLHKQDEAVDVAAPVPDVADPRLAVPRDAMREDDDGRETNAPGSAAGCRARRAGARTTGVAARFSRRSFLKGAAATGVLAGLAGRGLLSTQLAFADARTPATSWCCCRSAAGWTA